MLIGLWDLGGTVVICRLNYGIEKRTMLCKSEVVIQNCACCLYNSPQSISEVWLLNHGNTTTSCYSNDPQLQNRINKKKILSNGTRMGYVGMEVLIWFSMFHGPMK